ncbi:methyltransferase domain-containing protein [Streptomyces antarcticus]|uniref:methyltransferase domain-containing protein n=1 Tax=Streptomyces antarcticus TaxID=2996458 RepID=UPI00226DB4CE|nr:MULTISPECIES: methyltransferase domain-containing protein [unclassified Streptomyces]MCY0947190.1 methyltransferase domain-containing protein [Streptomyces sp. H34-AA3]MCZ4085371.1 methyltransferase domain-containing protein [Streptomyces sp. H34-S5]
MAATPHRNAPAVDGLVGGLLAVVAEQLGRPLPARLEQAFRRVHRHRFLPARIWLRDGTGGYELVDRAAEPARWMTAAYSDEPLVTQFTDGLPSSSASMPSMVARMLLLAGLGERPPGREIASPRVLELGAGTGFNAGLLCALLGDRQVTTVDLDPLLAARAGENLKAAGYAPRVVVGDAADGWPPGGPYDVVLATFSVDHVPPAWLTQARPGGRIVTPWTSQWCRYGTLSLTADEQGRAEGRFHAFASFMQMTRPRTAGVGPASVPASSASGEGAAEGSSTTLSPWAVAGGDLDAEFHIGLVVPGASFAWDTSGEHTHTRLEVADTTTGSWATVDYDGRTSAAFTVAQAGTRQRLWDEIAAAYRRWEQLGRPGIDRYGLSVAGRSAMVWVDSPATAVATR